MIFPVFICLSMSLSVVLVGPLPHQVYIKDVLGSFFWLESRSPIITRLIQSCDGPVYCELSWRFFYISHIIFIFLLYFSHIITLFPPISSYIWNKFAPIFLYFLPLMWVGDLLFKHYLWCTAWIFTCFSAF